MTRLPTETMTYDSEEFSELFQETTATTAQERMGERLMILNTVQRSAWLSGLVHWLGSHGPQSIRPMAATLLKAAPNAALGRVAAVRLTLNAATHHLDFQKHVSDGSDFQAKHQFGEAEHSYWQALRIFPLSGAPRVQYAHMLKDQQKYQSAVVNYCYALAVGAPLHHVTEHLLFAANRAQFDVSAADVERLAAAWNTLELCEDDWYAPPIYQDFFDFSLLFWGDAGMLSDDFIRPYLLKGLTRKSLFIELLRSPETLRRNRTFFVMMNERGSAGV